MALTARAQTGLAHAAGIACTTVEAFTEAELERLGLYWADHADTAQRTERLAKLEAASPELKAAVDAVKLVAADVAVKG